MLAQFVVLGGWGVLPVTLHAGGFRVLSHSHLLLVRPQATSASSGQVIPSFIHAELVLPVSLKPETHSQVEPVVGF